MDTTQEQQNIEKKNFTEAKKTPYEPPVIEDLGSIEANTFQTSIYLGG